MAIDLGKQIVVVSGLPRSGTSMMMTMLEAGGVEVFTDGVRRADEDNPNGYYEVELVKSLKKQEDKSWIAAAEGKAIKVVSSLLMDLPPVHGYRVVFMNRKLDEVLASQNKMRARRGDAAEANDQELMKLYERHLVSVKSWMRRQPNFSLLELGYADVVENQAAHAVAIQAFLGVSLDVTRMTWTADANLYRNRSRERNGGWLRHGEHPVDRA